MSQALLSGLVVGSAYVLMSLGFALEFGIADIVNAAHGTFVLGGMYATLKLTEAGLPVTVAVVMSVVIVAAVSYPLYVMIIAPGRAVAGHRLQLVYTLLLLSGLTAVYQLAFGPDLQLIHARFRSVQLFGATVTTAQIASFAIAIVVAVALFVLAKRTAIGKAAYAAGLYQRAARSLGAPIARIYTAIFVLGGALAGLAGGLIATFQPAEPTLGLEFVLVVFLIVIVGRTSLLGCLVLGLVYGVAQALLGYYAPASVASALTYAVFLVLLIGQRRTTTILQAVHRATRRDDGRAGSPPRLEAADV